MSILVHGSEGWRQKRIIMKTNRLFRFLRRTLRLDRIRILRPFQHRLRDRRLWALDRHSVARGVAIGFFFGIALPVAQIVFAAVAAVALRANPLLAAGSTLITNPITFPVIYYYAYRIGTFVTGRSATAQTDIEVSEEAAARALDVAGWFPTLMDWITTIGPPLAIGLLTLALATSLGAYLLIHATWGLVATRKPR
jgi:uncharacterized protein (DUF2062 family)